MGLLAVKLAALEHPKSLKIYNGFQVSIVAFWATFSVVIHFVSHDFWKYPIYICISFSFLIQGCFFSFLFYVDLCI